MQTLRRPVDLIVPEIVHAQPVHGIIADWRVEEAALSEILIGHFKAMGIYFCEPGHRDLFVKIIIFQLRFSPHVLAAVAKAERDDEVKRRSRLED